MKALVSACLLGRCCRYDGGGKADPGVRVFLEPYEAIPVCPEELGGLPTPRPPAERAGDRVVASTGEDVTEAFARGGEEACRICRAEGCAFAVLKARSPSCGSGMVYDGTFCGRLVPGWGVTAELLMANGVPVYSEERLPTPEELSRLLKTAFQQDSGGGNG